MKLVLGLSASILPQLAAELVLDKFTQIFALHLAFFEFYLEKDRMSLLHGGVFVDARMGLF